MPDDAVMYGSKRNNGYYTMYGNSKDWKEHYYGYVQFNYGVYPFPSSVNEIYIAKSLECYNSLDGRVSFVDEPIDYGDDGIYMGCLHSKPW